jgi:hypothetical protein
MTALIGVAVLGLVPLPSVGSLEATDRRRGLGPAPNETAASSYPERRLQAILAGMALRGDVGCGRCDVRRHKS